MGDTGLAFVNAGDGPADAIFRLYDSSFNLIATQELADIDAQFDSGHHLARYASEIFSEIRQIDLNEGVITVDSDQPLAVVTLRQHSDPTKSYPESLTTLSTFPVIAGRADRDAGEVSSGSLTDRRVFYFPQVGIGTTGDALFKTEFILANTGPEAELLIHFYCSDGSPMFVDLEDYGLNNTFQFDLGTGNAIKLKISGTSDLQVGYARVATNASVGGTAVFSYIKDDMTFFEAGVPSVLPRKNFAIFMDASTLNRDTGIALVNTDETAAVGSIRLYDLDHELKAEKQLVDLLSPFSPGNHVARYATEVFPEIRDLNLTRGLIEVTSSQPLAAITLRQNVIPKALPESDLFLLTAYPVIHKGLE
jgi:hypothetical protein